jgi:hypothetical protein
MMIRCRFTVQTRFSPCGNVIKNYFPGDEITLDKKVADGTILFPGRESAVIVEEYKDIPGADAQQSIPLDPPRGPRPDKKDVEDLEKDEEEEEVIVEEIIPENKQDKTPVDPQKETAKIEVSNKLKKKK